MKKLTVLFLCLCLCTGFLSTSAVAAKGTPLQDCHKVTLTKHDETLANKSVVRTWTADTALDSVDAELAGILSAWNDTLAPELPAAKNKTDKNSRLELEVCYSRTGLTWMSFLLLARTTYHRELTAQQLTTRTYDMTTGERILLTDIFPEDSEVWDMLQERVQQTLTDYFPDEEPSADVLAELTSIDSLYHADFTLHGMSLTLHYPAELLYPKHHSQLQVHLMYPEIREYMSEKAQQETDNASYYNFVALTFDDGPARTNTTLVLNNLMESGITATFFVVGNRIKEYDDLVQREHDENHAIGSHNWTHGDVSKMSKATMRAMPDKVNKAMIAAIGIPVRYDRVPYGLYNQMCNAKVGWPLIQWSLDTYDWRKLPSKTVLGKVEKQITDGDIILCHDIKDNTPTSAAMIAASLHKRGYMFLTIDELFAKDGVVLQPDTVYYRNKEGVTTRK